MTRLVRIREEDSLLMGPGDVAMVREHGSMWLRIAIDTTGTEPFADNLHWYKSLATGAEHCWFDHEIEEQDND